jgi:nucleoside-diphosphate-sugar epimerase
MKILLIGGSGFIGKHLAEKLTQNNHTIVIADIAVPIDSNKVEFEFLNLLISDFAESKLDLDTFDSVVNLAAITSDSSSNIVDYSTNYLGVYRLLQHMKRFEFKGSFIQISTQYVEAPLGYNHRSKSVQAPVNTYGESKLIAEQIIVNSGLSHWVILRPTNVWGPGHKNFPTGFWKVVSQGLYVHPFNKVVRSYGSVFTVVEQIKRVIELQKDQSNGKILYLGDDPMDSYAWVNEFSKNLKGKDVRRVSRILLLLVALAGEVTTRIFTWHPPMNLTRYRSMTKDFVVDMSPTSKLIGKIENNFSEEVRLTSEWFQKSQRELGQT